ncbi:MAG: ribose 5-phosphate isomerase B [Candidatus Aminicenantes bacterium]|nr:ribose 5-phosphate isomerase B [Candidatus Aminicenantes bacterium]NIM80315.1 ribose 5-phosphate isomerase B [Candidatus Aminicenantes bacterium]NIN16805.1 ribose 5-phosphate isomerase B [Candidatus Aminicenantes bacterium]NIN40661.1 ribose 5-phosphate isomerase B [Candidatus Aminicenantes bacterium]NIN83484.1 ribose 5-phosphate isomerase B [Candidatus Aminicenantes bacterium]
MQIFLASDHAGFELKEEVKQYLLNKNFTVEDMGTGSAESVNWAEYGAKAAKKVSEDPENARGIIICGSGIGMSMVSNKFRNVRAALCNDEYAAEMSRKHNNANVLNMGARVIDKEKALKIVEVWLNTEFEGGRHQKRLDYLHQTVEKENFK